MYGKRRYSRGWVKVVDAINSTLVKAKLSTGNYTHRHCIGSALVNRQGCWFFLKGGFVLDSTYNTSLLYFQFSGEGADQNLSISVASASLQPFTDFQWRKQQQDNIATTRKRVVTIHVADVEGNRLPKASVQLQQISKDFPFGSAISKTILGNSAYQKWFVDRFNAAVFENELKWYVTEVEPGKLNYTYADRLLEFVRSNQIVARGHNIFWEDPVYTPAWVRELDATELVSAVISRIENLLNRYKGEFVHWDVNNEMLHFDFYEHRLGPNTSFRLFQIAQRSDPLATLFMNDFNVIETCNDDASTVDSYVLRLKELMDGGAMLQGIGLEGHFTKPNIPLMRAVLDKLGTLGLPIWLTEIDISKTVDRQTQAIYLEHVLREGFSHPSVNGIMLWTAVHDYGCYQMCLTDVDMKNLPAGDVVDRLLKEWETKSLNGETDEHGLFSFNAFLGEYKVDVRYGNRSVLSSLSLFRDMEDTNAGVVKATGVSPLRASLVRWEILRRALLPRYSASSATKSDASFMEIKKISRKSSVGFNLIPFQIQSQHFNGYSNASLEKVINNKDFCICYTLPTEISQKLILFQRLENCIGIDDFEISDKHNIDNTGIVCSWPSEDVLAYFCLNHIDMFRSKRVLELGSGYGLAGMTIAVATSAYEVVISDGNPQVVDYIQKNVTMNAHTFGDTDVQPMNLHWNQDLDSNMLNSFDIIVASDCTFFTEFHDNLALIVKSFLKHEGSSEAIFLNPKRGDSLGKFLQKVHDIGLCYELVENYDDQIWKRHIEIQDGNDTSWPNYDKDHCYPLLCSSVAGPLFLGP